MQNKEDKLPVIRSLDDLWVYQEALELEQIVSHAARTLPKDEWYLKGQKLVVALVLYRLK